MVLAVIPARFASTRLPGKPLADIGGTAMILRVWERVGRARGVDRVIVATDDERIAAVGRRAGAEVVVTGDFASGTDRVAEVARGIPCDVVVNVQGDEPFIDPSLIDSVVRIASVGRSAAPIGTAASPWPAGWDLRDPSRVKVVMDLNGHALAFSRAPAAGVVLLHHGLYAYRRETLHEIAALPPSPRERDASLEQLRWMDAGIPIRVVLTPDPPFSVDTPEDLERARRVVGSFSEARA